MCVHFPAGTTMNGTTGSIPVVGTASNTTPDTVNVNLTAQASPHITVDKTNYFGTSPAPGGQVVYRIYVDNSTVQGSYNLTNVRITDLIPAGATFVAGAVSNVQRGYLSWTPGAGTAGVYPVAGWR